MSDEPINWEIIAKERLDAIVQFKDRAEAAEAKLLDAEMKRDHADEAALEYKVACEAAEARVNKLEKVLKEIYLHSSDGNAQLLAASWIAGKDEM